MTTFPFDYFVGALQCEACGNISEADESTDIQTKICKVRHLNNYRAGDRIPVDHDKIESNGYILLKFPEKTKPYLIIESWGCPSCGSLKLAAITIQNGIITSIKATELTAEKISAVNYLTEDLRALLADRRLD